MNQQLQEYVEGQLNAGVSSEDVKKALLGAGWQEKDIEEVMAGTGTKSAPAPVFSPVPAETIASEPVGPAVMKVEDMTPSAGVIPFEEKKPVTPPKQVDFSVGPAAKIDDMKSVTKHMPSMTVMIMGGVIILLIAALIFVFVFMRSRGAVREEALIQQAETASAQVTNMTQELEKARTDVESVTAERDVFMRELSLLVETPGITDGNPETATFRGSVSKTKTGVYVFTTAHGVEVVLIEDEGSNLADLLDPYAESGDELDVSGTYVRGSAELTVTRVNDAEVVVPEEEVQPEE